MILLAVGEFEGNGGLSPLLDGKPVGLSCFHECHLVRAGGLELLLVFLIIARSDVVTKCKSL